MIKQKSPYVLKIESLSDSFHDSDEVILHACFQTLVNFMEEEKPDTTDWAWSGEESYNAWQEIQSLYDWWTSKRPNKPSFIDDVPDDYMLFTGGSIVWQDDKYPHANEDMKKHHEYSQKMYEEDEANLHRLIKVRRFLWT